MVTEQFYAFIMMVVTQICAHVSKQMATGLNNNKKKKNLGKWESDFQSYHIICKCLVFNVFPCCHLGGPRNKDTPIVMSTSSMRQVIEGGQALFRIPVNFKKLQGLLSFKPLYVAKKLQSNSALHKYT